MTEPSRRQSPLRTWLRQERAREHRRCYFAASGEAAWLGGGYTLLRKGELERYATWIREPTADVHKHGRDCDLTRHFGGAADPATGDVWTVVEIDGPPCGVEGVW